MSHFDTQVQMRRSDLANSKVDMLTKELRTKEKEFECLLDIIVRQEYCPKDINNNFCDYSSTECDKEASACWRKHVNSVVLDSDNGRKNF